MNFGSGRIMPNMICVNCGAIHTLIEYFEEKGMKFWECNECGSQNQIRLKGKKSRYFQVFNWANKRWVKYDYNLGRVVEIRKEEGPYPGIPKYKSPRTKPGYRGQ
jgi:Zn ribbon nucleic-acid-binding protein